MDMKTLGIYGSHDSSVCGVVDGEYRIFELEKFVGKRNCGLTKDPKFQRFIPKATDEEYIEFLSYIHNLVGNVEAITYNQLVDKDFDIIGKIFNTNIFVPYGHHDAHAMCTFYQSEYEKSLIVTFDGGGEDEKGNPEYFNFYLGDKLSGIKLIKKYPLYICNPYFTIAIPIKEIKDSPNVLPYSGKLMGLSAYGEYREDWDESFEKYFYTYNSNRFFKEIGIDVKAHNIYEGKFSYDLAYMAQYTFEKIFLETFIPIWKDNNCLPVCFSGGGALNVINNQKILRVTDGKLFIPPNPNDCGLSFGGMLSQAPPKEQIQLMYNGYDIIKDKEIDGALYTIDEILKYILDGQIIGILKDRSEIGPRALGNRSILCDPSIPNIKEKLNSTVKFREWFRPFAPVIRTQDVSKYFNNISNSMYMEFCPEIKPEYKTIVSGIVHVDGTSRLQTVSKESNLFIYSLLTKMEEIGKTPILLNTSLNTKGSPLIQKTSEAYEMLNKTGLDKLIINDILVSK